MLTKRVELFLVFGLLGSVSLIHGILIHCGVSKRWWAAPYRRAGQEPFVSMPLGMMLLFWAIAMLLPQQWAGLLVIFSGLVFGLSTLVFLFTRPDFLKPDWLRWLEDYHKEHIPLLRREARQMGANQWAKRVKTQAGLEQWVEEVLRKHRQI